MTTLVTGRLPSSSRWASQSCPTISAVVRLRLKPCLPVEQNAQSSTQPAWLDTHSVPRLVSGMNTASTAFAPSTLSSHLRVPSAASVSPTTAGQSITAMEGSFSLKGRARSLIRPKSASPRWCSQRSTCLARKRFSPWASKKRSRPSASSPSRFSFIDLRKEERDFLARGIRPVGAVHRVGVDRVGEVGADRAPGGFLRIGGAHQLAVLRDRVVALEHLDHHRARDHEIDQVLEERALAVHRVEAFGLLARQMRHARRDDAQSRAFEAREDLADDVLLDRVGLDDREGLLHCH